jgi:hypothetical protein
MSYHSKPFNEIGGMNASDSEISYPSTIGMHAKCTGKPSALGWQCHVEEW